MITKHQHTLYQRYLITGSTVVPHYLPQSGAGALAPHAATVNQCFHMSSNARVAFALAQSLAAMQAAHALHPLWTLHPQIALVPDSQGSTAAHGQQASPRDAARPLCIVHLPALVSQACELTHLAALIVVHQAGGFPLAAPGGGNALLEGLQMVVPSLAVDKALVERLLRLPLFTWPVRFPAYLLGAMHRDCLKHGRIWERVLLSHERTRTAELG